MFIVAEMFCNFKGMLIISLSIMFDSHPKLRFTAFFLFQMHFLYQYSLHFFLDIYHTVLYENANLKSVSDHMQRLSLITKDLFQVRHF